MMRLRISLLCCCIFLISCGDDDSLPGVVAIDGCSGVEQATFISDTMKDIYFWVDEMPDLDPANYGSASGMLAALRYPALDRFSFIDNAEASNNFFSAGQFIGFGFSSALAVDDTLQLTLVYSGSPAANAGFERGYKILSIGGVLVSDHINNGTLNDAFGPEAVGETVSFGYRDNLGNNLQTTVTKAVVTIDPIPVASIVQAAPEPVGYLHFRTFIEPANQALQQAFAMFKAEGVKNIIVDVRYNGGGLVSVAELLGDLMVGPAEVDSIYSKRLHNSANTNFNSTRQFEAQASALDLEKVTFITSGGTASASELVINSLKPYVQTALVGSRSVGKPVGSYGFEFCEQVFFPISFETVNANDEGQFFDGLDVDCAAEDDLNAALGDTQEAMLQAALEVATTGVCSSTQQAQKQTPPVQEKSVFGVSEPTLRNTLIGAH